MIGKGLLASGVEVFLDEWDILGGDSIPSELEAALTDCNIFLFALSPAALESKWVKTEYYTFLYRKINDHSLRIIPVLLAECQAPTFIAPLKRVDFRDFDTDLIASQVEPMEQLLHTIFRSPKKPVLRSPSPALASYECRFQPMKNPPSGLEDEYWELGFKNITDSPLINFQCICLAPECIRRQGLVGI